MAYVSNILFKTRYFDSMCVSCLWKTRSLIKIFLLTINHKYDFSSLCLLDAFEISLSKFFTHKPDELYPCLFVTMWFREQDPLYLLRFAYCYMRVYNSEISSRNGMWVITIFVNRFVFRFSTLDFGSMLYKCSISVWTLILHLSITSGWS